MCIIPFVPEYLEECSRLLWRWLKCSQLWDETKLVFYFHGVKLPDLLGQKVSKKVVLSLQVCAPAFYTGEGGY